MSAFNVQCCWRSNRARRIYSELRARRELQANTESVLALQCQWRVHVARRAYKVERDRRAHAIAIQLQCMWRARRAHHLIETLRSNESGRRRLAVIHIQSYW